MTLVLPSFGQVPPQGGTSDSIGHIVLGSQRGSSSKSGLASGFAWVRTVSGPLSRACPEAGGCCLRRPLSMQAGSCRLQRPNEISLPAKASPQLRHPRPCVTRSCSAEPPTAWWAQPGLWHLAPHPTPCPMEFGPAGGRSKRMKDPAQLYSPASSLSIALLESAGGGGQAEGDKQD